VFKNSLEREISNETAAISRWNPVFKHILKRGTAMARLKSDILLFKMTLVKYRHLLKRLAAAVLKISVKDIEELRRDVTIEGICSNSLL
jgi:hypothetical protein